MKRTKWIALLAALIASYAVWQILSSQVKKQEAELDYRQVVVAGTEIKKGAVVQRGQLEVKKIPRQYTPKDALEEGGAAVGKVAQSGIVPGEILTPARLSDPEDGQAGLAYKIPEDHRALTLTVGIEAGVAGMILPGDNVDILISMPADMENVPLPAAPEEGAEGAEAPQILAEGQTGDTNFDTFYLLEKVPVLACSRSLSPEAAEQTTAERGEIYDSVTLSLTRGEAMDVEHYTYAARQYGGNIRLTLRPSEQEAEASQNETEE